MFIVSEESNRLGDVYMALLRMPYAKWRAENQSMYIEVRDSLAEMKHMTHQRVQEHYEELSAMKKHYDDLIAAKEKL